MVIIFKPTIRCNIRCAHCYVGDTSNTSAHTMTLDQAGFLLDKLPAGSEIVFHGGEPTMMGIDFLTVLTAQFDGKFRFSMQTNLTLVNEQWAGFMRERLAGRVSSSCDVGPSLRPINTQKWLQTTQMLKRHGVHPYVVSVLWSGNEDLARTAYSLFEPRGLSFRINAIENIGYAKAHGSLRHTPGKYAETVNALFDQWFMDPKTGIVVDPCAEFLAFLVMGSSVKKCPFTSGCQAHISSLYPDGTMIPCGGFKAEEFAYGNLFRQSFDEMFMSAPFRAACSRLENLPQKCYTCEYFALCEGGCRLEAYSHYGDIYRETSLCEEYRLIFEHISRRISEEPGDIMDWWDSLQERRFEYIP